MNTALVLVKSILKIESTSSNDIRVKREHFTKLTYYIAKLLYLLHRKFQVEEYSRILVVKLLYLLDRESLKQFDVPITKILYMRYFYGPYNPSIVDVLEHLVSKGVLSHEGTVYEYVITSVETLRKLASKINKELKTGCEELNIDYSKLKKLVIETTKKVIDLDRAGVLIEYVHSLPEVLETPFGEVINLRLVKKFSL